MNESDVTIMGIAGLDADVLENLCDTSGARLQGLREVAGSAGMPSWPVVVVHCSTAAPAEAFASVQHGQTWLCIAENDFDSKLPFSVLKILLTLARTWNAFGGFWWRK